MLCQPLELFPDFKELVKSSQALIKEVGFNLEIGNQISLHVNHPANSSASSWYESIGRIRKGEIELNELDFKFIHPKLKNGYIHKWIQSLEKYGVVRARLMLVPGRTCYSIHSDPNARIHIPLITNPSCLMCFPDHGIMKHLPADGRSWFVDTRKKHTFMNCSTEDRIHLVCVVTNYDHFKTNDINEASS